MKYQPAPRRAVALVTTLALLAILTVLIVGFTSSMRTERAATGSMAESARAGFIAQSALAHATSILVENIPSPGRPKVDTPAYTAVNWAVNPGRLALRGKVGTTFSDTPQYVDLHTGEVTGTGDNKTSANLNAWNPVSGEYPISPEGEEMRVKWVNLAKDATAAFSSTNPITGRYAFWMDDESARINVNTAAGKPADIDVLAQSQLSPRITRKVGGTDMKYILGHPSSVEFAPYLPDKYVPQPKLFQDIYSRGFLPSTEAIRNDLYVTNSADFYKDYRFDITAFSKSPEFNVFGKSRIYLMESPESLDRGGPYQMQGDNTQPFYSVDTELYANAKVNPMVANRDVLKTLWVAIGKYFQREDWPGYSNKSFVKKWAAEAEAKAGSPDVALDWAKQEADQVALNLIYKMTMGSGYTGSPGDTSTDGSGNVYLRTSQFNSVNTGGLRPPDRHAWIGPISGKPMMPVPDIPLINEVGVTVTAESVPYKPEVIAADPTKADHYYLKYSFRTEVRYQGLGVQRDGKNGLALGSMAIRPTYIEYLSSGDRNGAPATQRFSQYANKDATSYPSAPLGDFYTVFTGTIGASPAPLPEPSFAVIDTATYYLGARLDGGSVKWQRIVTKASGTNTDGTPKFNGTAAVFKAGLVNLDFWLRTGTCSVSSSSQLKDKPYQMIPVPSPRPNSADPPGQVDASHPVFADRNDSTLNFQLQLFLDPAGASNGVYWDRSLEVADARVSARVKDWNPLPQGTDSFGTDNSIATGDDSKDRSWNYNAPNLAGQGFDDNNQQWQAKYPYRAINIGMLGFVPTGVQRGIPNSTLNWHRVPEAELADNSPPDWLLLDLFAPPLLQNGVKVASYTEVTPLTAMNSTAGKINVNTKVYPENFKLKNPRTRPLQALFAGLPRASAAQQGLTSYSESGKTLWYNGEFAQVEGVADVGVDEWEKEILVRNLANLVTSQSNTFGVYGVAQSVKKKPGNKSYDTFETGDVVTAEKRFHAVIERGVWPGRDGLPGNGHTRDEDGGYDRLAASKGMPQNVANWGTSGVHTIIDGPDVPELPSPEWGSFPANPSDLNEPLDNLDNPLRALMKYRVVYFKYITE
jgi:hypothetical protein